MYKRQTFNVLRTAFEQKAVAIQQSPVGINPDFALVFEIIGTVDSFYTAVQHVEGLEWIFDKESEPFTADEDFYYIDEQGQASDEALNGKLYCVMSNQQAMMQMISLWNRYQNGDDNVFQRGFAGLRDVFTHIKISESGEHRTEFLKLMQWNIGERILTWMAILPFHLK